MIQLLVDGHWLTVRDGDARALAIFKQHYSYRHRAHGQLRGSSTFVGQGEKMVLLTADLSALFVWQRSTVERRDHQEGARCSIFRNTGAVLSSTLITEAESLAWARWPGLRLFTYVNAGRIRSTNPGYCFLMAGWTRLSQRSPGGLVILEKLPLVTG